MFLPMAKVELVGPKSLLPQTLSLLHNLGTVHFEPIPTEAAGEERPHPIILEPETKVLISELEDKTSFINGILDSFPAIDKPETSEFYQKWIKKFAALTPQELIAEVDRAIASQGEKARTLANQKDKAKLDLLALQRYERIVQKIQPLAVKVPVPPGSLTTAFLVDRSHPQVLEVIRHELANIGEEKVTLEHEAIDEETIAGLVVYPKEMYEQIHEALSDSVNLIRLPEEYAGMTPQETLAAIQARVEELPQEVKQVDNELSEASSESYFTLKALAGAVRDRIEELSYLPQCGETEFTFLIRGWVPRRDLKRTIEAVTQAYGDRVLIEEREVSEKELAQVPVVLENPKWARPFELILNILQPPKYGTVDPTPFVAILLPAFFGIIVGDAGYGLVWLIVALLMRKKFKNNKVVMSVLTIFTAGAISTIFFGILYGEFFGDLPHRFHLIHEFHLFGSAVTIPFDRMKWMMEFLYLTVGIGAFSMLIGLVLGIVNAIRGHHKKHVYEKIGMTLTLISIILVVMLSLFKVTLTPALILLLIGLVLLVYGGGMMGPMEVFGLIGNVFSFARIMALGLSGVVLAFVANTLAASMGNIAAGMAIAFLLHGIALLVHAFSPFIHAIRLNIIEFFNRFYETGNKQYRPFNKK